MKKHIYQGSVKDIYETEGNLEFHFSNRYSIFDWGEMPDHIPNKGKYLNQIAIYFFKLLNNKETFNNIKIPSFLNPENCKYLNESIVLDTLKREGLKSHFIKSIDEESFLAKSMKVIRPKYINANFDYSEYSLKQEDTIIPLEVVFRLGAPIGSSLLQRADEEFTAQHKINVPIVENKFFDNIVIEFYTKLEPIDRLLERDEAQIISGLSSNEFNKLIEISKILSLVVFQIFDEANFKLWDGKFEFACGKKIDGEREIILIDSIGPDELRLTRNSIPFSKEILRQFYKDSAWLEEFKKLKKKYPIDFHKNPSLSPERLSPNQLTQAEYIYKSIANILINQEHIFDKKIDQELKSYFKKIIIFGKGGREHALADKLAQISQVQSIFVIPGNPGITGEKIQTIEIPENEIIPFCLNNDIDFAIIGPEDLLQKGLSDDLENNQIPCFGPSKASAVLETSKAFSKSLMQKYQIPTAEFCVFTSENEAINYINNLNWPKYVIKQSSLAAGKGVIICDTKDEAIETAKQFLKVDNKIVIEEFLEGREVSFFALCLEEEYKTLGHACDYKRLRNNNIGPNTGGMGCYAPAFWLSEENQKVIIESILLPTLKAMITEGIPFKGVLFIGIMMTKAGPKVLEYNVRFGDPETQTLLPLIENGLIESIEAIAKNDKRAFKQVQIIHSSNSSVHIVKAAKGYPGANGEKIESNQIIHNHIHPNASTHLYFAGVKGELNELLTNGGRVLGVTSIAKDLKDARSIAYQQIERIHFQGEQFREDIGL